MRCHEGEEKGKRESKLAYSVNDFETFAVEGAAERGVRGLEGLEHGLHGISAVRPQYPHPVLLAALQLGNGGNDLNTRP